MHKAFASITETPSYGAYAPIFTTLGLTIFRRGLAGTSTAAGTPWMVVRALTNLKFIDLLTSSATVEGFCPAGDAFHGTIEGADRYDGVWAVMVRQTMECNCGSKCCGGEYFYSSWHNVSDIHTVYTLDGCKVNAEPDNL